MEFFNIIEERRSVKYYDPNHVMTDDETSKILNSALLSPTSFNMQNWRFLVVKDKEQRASLKEAAGGQEQVTDASLLFVMCADLKSWSKDPDRYWRNAPDNVRTGLVSMIRGYYDGNEVAQRDEAMRSCGIAAQTIMLTSKAMGYDSCPMVGFDFKRAASIINLPEDYVITMLIAVGLKVKDAQPRGGQLTVEDVVVYDKF
ncbi:MAG: nitroreductase [Lysobacterales bacterium]|jgi:nitroreductase